MPFDAVDFHSWRGEPPIKPKSFWKETIRDMSIQAVGVVASLVASAFVGAAIDGFPPSPPTIPPPPDYPAASLLSEAGALATFLFMMSALVRWHIRKFFKEIDDL